MRVTPARNKSARTTASESRGNRTSRSKSPIETESRRIRKRGSNWTKRKRGAVKKTVQKDINNNTPRSSADTSSTNSRRCNTDNIDSQGSSSRSSRSMPTRSSRSTERRGLDARQVSSYINSAPQSILRSSANSRRSPSTTRRVHFVFDVHSSGRKRERSPSTTPSSPTVRFAPTQPSTRDSPSSTTTNRDESSSRASRSLRGNSRSRYPSRSPSRNSSDGRENSRSRHSPSSSNNRDGSSSRALRSSSRDSPDGRESSRSRHSGTSSNNREGSSSRTLRSSRRDSSDGRESSSSRHSPSSSNIRERSSSRAPTSPSRDSSDRRGRSTSRHSPSSPNNRERSSSRTLRSSSRDSSDGRGSSRSRHSPSSSNNREGSSSRTLRSSSRDSSDGRGRSSSRHSPSSSNIRERSSSRAMRSSSRDSSDGRGNSRSRHSPSSSNNRERSSSRAPTSPSRDSSDGRRRSSSRPSPSSTNNRERSSSRTLRSSSRDLSRSAAESRGRSASSDASNRGRSRSRADTRSSTSTPSTTTNRRSRSRTTQGSTSGTSSSAMPSTRNSSSIRARSRSSSANPGTPEDDLKKCKRGGVFHKKNPMDFGDGLRVASDPAPCGSETYPCANVNARVECPLKSPCGNFKIAAQQYADVEVYKVNDVIGNGLRTKVDLKRGDFVIEYTGKLVDEAAFNKIVALHKKNKKKRFFGYHLGGGYFIDSAEYGNIARFVNHRCEPNMVVERWDVRGTERRDGVRTLIFRAGCDIKAGESLYINYNTDYNNKNVHRCTCAGANCTGFLGRGPSGEVTSSGTQELDDIDEIPWRNENVPRPTDEEVEQAIDVLRTELSDDGTDDRKLQNLVTKQLKKETDKKKQRLLLEVLKSIRKDGRQLPMRASTAGPSSQPH